MARIWYAAGGPILRLAKTDAEEDRYGAPAGAAGSLAFDETTNAAALSALDTDWNAHTCPGGVLKRNGVNVALAADAADTADRKAVRANLPALFAALRAGTATGAQ